MSEWMLVKVVTTNCCFVLSRLRRGVEKNLNAEVVVALIFSNWSKRHVQFPGTLLHACSSLK